MKSNYLEVLIEHKLVIKKIKAYAVKLIEALKKDPDIIFVNVLNGSSPFVVDLIREINKLGYNKKINLEYICASSYQNTKSMDLKIKKWIPLDKIKDHTIYLFEDVIDTGKTLTNVIAKLKEQGANQINVVALTDKKAVHGEVNFEYETLFDVKNVFLVGYGLDCDEKFRQLRDICIYKN